jgi:hypothetical protein
LLAIVAILATTVLVLTLSLLGLLATIAFLSVGIASAAYATRA